jgi:hypothetical protein
MPPKSNSYERKVTVNSSISKVYDALTTGYEHWWTTTGGATFETVGDQIKFTFPPQVSYWTFQAKTLIKDQEVDLICTDAYHLLLDLPDAPKGEWLASRLHFKLTPIDGLTKIHFRHEGLTPDLNCYDICEEGWDHFFMRSLQDYLNSGQGAPYMPEDIAADNTSVANA